MNGEEHHLCGSIECTLEFELKAVRLAAIGLTDKRYPLAPSVSSSIKACFGNISFTYLPVYLRGDVICCEASLHAADDWHGMLLEIR